MASCELATKDALTLLKKRASIVLIINAAS